MASHEVEISKALSSISASPTTLSLLRDLHSLALAEPTYHSTDGQPQTAALERFVALDTDKCALVYLLLRSSGATRVVEAGTSFGLSTIYLALAATQNAAIASASGGAGKAAVIATENEPTKAARAREHWAKAGDGLAECIDLRVGDLRETLKTDLPESVDFLLLDIWTPLALPALKLVKPKMKPGATVVTDNVTSCAEGYQDLYAYLNDPANGFRWTCAPYSGGLLIAVYMG